MASNVNESKKSLLPYVRKLVKDAEKIAAYINEINFFKSPLTLQCISHQTESGASTHPTHPTESGASTRPTESSAATIIFKLNKETFSSALFYNEKSSSESFTHVYIQYVNSNLGHGTGIFLFYLQLLLSYLENVTHLRLENFTDDPLRAWLGIYKRFTVNQRQHPRSEFVGKSNANKLHIAEGAMRLEMYADFLHDWSEDLIALDKKATNTPESPWEPDYLDNLKSFFYLLRSNFSQVRGLLSPNSHSSKKSKSKGGYLISKKSSGKMLRKQHRTRKHCHAKKKHHTRRHHSKKNVSHRRKKSYGGVRPTDSELNQLKRNIEVGEADKVQDFVMKHDGSGLIIRNAMIRSNILPLEREFNIDLSRIDDEVREILIEWGYINA